MQFFIRDSGMQKALFVPQTLELYYSKTPNCVHQYRYRLVTGIAQSKVSKLGLFQIDGDWSSCMTRQWFQLKLQRLTWLLLSGVLCKAPYLSGTRVSLLKPYLVRLNLARLVKQYCCKTSHVTSSVVTEHVCPPKIRQ